MEEPVTESAAGNVTQKERTIQKLTEETTKRDGEKIINVSFKYLLTNY